MSWSLLLWKPTAALRATPGQIAMGIGEYEISGLAPLDEHRLIGAIDARFPGWRAGGSDRWGLECEVQSTYLTATFFGSTPAEVPSWFLELARAEGLAVFDDRTDEISDADRAAHRRALAAARAQLRREEREELRAEYAALLERAERGDASAQFTVGQRLSFGEGVRCDPAAAAGWYCRAAEAGNVDAMVNLAALLRAGKGVPCDPALAVRWLERALPSDGLFAAFELGQMYAHGEGVPTDPARAEQLFRTALAQGHPEARRALRLLNEAGKR